MKHAKHSPLIRELLAEDSLEAVRRQSLELGMAVTRHRRRRANWAKGALISTFLVAAICLLIPVRQSPSARNRVSGVSVANTAMVATVAPSANNSAVVRFISDDELLALFPGRSMALIGPPGHKDLVFLDQAPLSGDSHTGSSR